MALRSTHLGSAALLTILLPSGPALAQEGGATLLPPITLVGTAEGDTTGIIGERETTGRQPTTLNELFATSPDVAVSGANRTAAQRVYVRGLEETNLNVTIDGVKQGGNLYPHTGNNAGIDPDLLKRVEVQAGTGSALSGPGALGGAIRYVTKSAEDLLLPGQTNGAMLKLSGQTNGARVTPGVAVYGTPNDRIGYLLYGTKSWASDYRDGGGRTVSDTDSEPLSLLAKLRLRPAEGHEIEVIEDYRQDNGLRAYRSNFGVPATHADSIPENQKLTRRSTSLSYGYRPGDNPLVDARAQISDNKSTLKRLVANRLTGDWLTRGADLRNRSRLGGLTLTYGYDYTWDKSQGRSGAGRSGSETAETHGFYAQGEQRLADRWTLSAGLRYDRASLTDLAGNHYDHGRLSPNAGVRFEPIEGLALFASWAEAYQGLRPVPALILLSGINRTATDRTLEGSVAHTVQGGFEYTANGWRAGATLFSTLLKDTVLYGGKGGTAYARSNGGDARTKGVTAHAGGDWGNWSADLSYAHSDITYNGAPVGPNDWLNGVTPQGDRIGASLGYALPEHDLRVTWTSQFVLAEKDLPAGFVLRELPAYDVHDVSVVWRPSPAQEVNLAVTNLFDRRYLDHTTPYSVSGGTTTLYEMGRSVRLAAAFKF